MVCTKRGRICDFFAMEWSDDKVFDLITLYEKNPCLYSVKSKDYHNRVKKRMAVQKIAEQLQTTEFDVSKKLKYLRSQFGDELKKAGLTKSSMATEETYAVKWKFFGALSFLQKHVNVKRPCIASNLEMETEMEEEVTSDGHWPQAVLNGHLETAASPELVKPLATNAVKTEMQSESSSTESSPTLTNSKTSSKRKRRYSTDLKSSAIDKSLVAMQQYFTACAFAMSQSQPKSSADDDSDMLFAKMIGAEVKKLRNAALKRTVKRKIFDLVFDAQSMDAEEQNQNEKSGTSVS